LGQKSVTKSEAVSVAMKASEVAEQDETIKALEEAEQLKEIKGADVTAAAIGPWCAKKSWKPG
jgi:electron transfer flavoprotein alpha/beta subunit